MLNLRGVLPVAAVAAVLTSGCEINVSADQFVGKEEKTFTVTGTPELALKTFDGAIEVTAWDKPVVGLTIERRAGTQAEAEKLEVVTKQDGNRIVIEAIQPERQAQVGFNVGRSVRFVVSVPKQTNLQARTGDGAIAVKDVQGRLELRTGDGAIAGTGLDGEVIAQTGDGAVALEGVKGNVDVNTGDGSVRIVGAPTGLKAHTGDGAVALTVEAGASITRDWEISTGDGSVSVELPANVNVELDASTGDGRVTAGDFGIEPTGEEKNELRGRVGSGGSTIRLRSGDGSITVAKR